MALKVDKVDVWATTIEDRPGSLASKLNVLTQAGADLEFIIARRSPDKPGMGVLFVTPLKGDAEIAAITGLSTNSVGACRRELSRPLGVGPAGAPPAAAVGPPPVNAPGRPPIGAAGVPPAGAAGAPPVGAAGAPPAGAAGAPPVGRDIKRLP